MLWNGNTWSRSSKCRIVFFNLQRMHEVYSSCFVFVCVVSVTMLAATCLIYMLKPRCHYLSFLWCFLHMHFMDFIENALFINYGDICRSSLPSWQTFDRQNRQWWLLSWRPVCTSSDRSYIKLDWLITEFEHTKLSARLLDFFMCTNSADMWSVAIMEYCVIHILVVTILT